MNASPQFDLIVIGSGPAGEKGAALAAYFGKKVALIEREPVLGGAAANTGTLPSKTLRETAVFLSGFKHRELSGLQLKLRDKVTVRDFMAREQLVTQTERARVMENMRRHGVNLYMGAASIVDANTVAVKPDRCPESRLDAGRILIATGSYPFRPAGFPFHDPRVYDSNTILMLHDIPPTMLVVGGGVIGCEYACIFAALGVEVTIVEKRDTLVGFLDDEVAAALRSRMEEAGIRILTSDGVNTVHDNGCLDVTLKSGLNLKVQTILISSGRCGNTEGLGLEKVGITVNDRGQIPVNEQFQTCVPNIYAAGDVIGNPALASTSMEQARLAMAHAFGIEQTFMDTNRKLYAYGIYTIPECSMVGETEESLIEKKIPYFSGKSSYAQNARGQIIGDTQGFLKLLFHADDMRLLGVHFIGELATELVHVGLMALQMNATADLFVQACYNYPTLTEIYKYATYDAMGKRLAKLKSAARSS
jgi:NAD(P) transhydrogenase